MYHTMTQHRLLQHTMLYYATLGPGRGGASSCGARGLSHDLCMYYRYIYIYIYVCICVYMCIHMHVYIHIYRYITSPLILLPSASTTTAEPFVRMRCSQWSRTLRGG